MKIQKLTGIATLCAGAALCLIAALVFIMGGGSISPASADELASGIPATAVAPASPTNKDWTIGPPVNPVDPTAGMMTTAAEIQAALRAMPEFSIEGQYRAAFLSMPSDYVVLPGDDVSFIGGAWTTQGVGPVGPGGTYTAPPAGNWVPKSQFIQLDEGNTGLTWDDIDFASWPTNCAPGTPAVAPNQTVVVWDGWCMGDPGVFQFTIKDITVPSAAEQTGWTPYERWWDIQPDAHLVDPAATVFGGPNNPRGGAESSTYSQVNVLDPKLQVIKEVCSTGTGCDPTLVTGDNTPVLDGMANTIGQWVDASLTPVGTTNIQWRITAINTGNVALGNVHIANDDWGYTNIADAGKVDASPCATHVFGTLAAGASASWGCTTPVAGILKGDVVNGVNLNASLAPDLNFPNGFLSPDGTNISTRFKGNPENGSDGSGFVGSNTDIARAAIPSPAIKLTKWVCETGTGCAIPTGATLTTLAGYTTADGVTQGQPAGGWVKETTVAYGTAVNWLIVVTNTGNTYMSDVTVPTEYTLDGSSGTHVDLTVTPASVASLAPGASAVFTTSTTSVTNTNAYIAGDHGDSNNIYGEPTYNLGSDVVNLAQAQGTPADDENGTLIEVGGSPLSEILTNQATAEVRTQIETPPPDTGVAMLRNPLSILASGVIIALITGIGTKKSRKKSS
jgi:hypothetical protein